MINLGVYENQRGQEYFQLMIVLPPKYWFSVGYSSWSYEQLFDEIGLGVWDVDNNQLDFAWPRSKSC
ncbi:unnamed protein product [Brassica napus]|uniref:(rape) hypothetical protein n=1 Tax=Brassica napus TaxID=3708 RepID=A0A816L807_BRANA|nr:unnamed protein product [Brassica napus]